MSGDGFVCDVCGGLASVELVTDGNRVRSVRFRCDDCGRVANGARVREPAASGTTTTAKGSEP